MIVEDYIKGRFASFGIKLNEADLFDIYPGTDEEMTSENTAVVKKGICGFIPSLLARPSSISESGFSMSWDKSALKDYYDILCTETGTENRLRPSVKFIRL